MRVRIVVLVACLVTIAFAAPDAIRPAVITDSVGTDPDDPAIWVNAKDPDRSLILGTDKAALPHGALFVFGLDGKTRSKIEGLDRPNNVDVGYGLILGKNKIDIAVVPERGQHWLRVFRVDSDSGTLIETGEVKVFEGELRRARRADGDRSLSALP